ncbi:MAG: oligoribonuclease [Myxococcales bacterium]|nr:oligoribonuclease [Myxococcales bacterium]
MAVGGNLVWIDMEMSGLDAERERILEIAVLVTDGELEVIAEGPSLVVHQSDEVLAGMDEWNTKHHGDSGLTERVRASTVTETEAEAQVLAFLSEHCAPKSAPLAGNSVHQDRRFLRRYMPKLDDFLHYRIVDVSTIKELGSRWYPREYDGRPNKRAQHRAMDDIRESLEELRYYRQAFFKPRG